MPFYSNVRAKLQKNSIISDIMTPQLPRYYAKYMHKRLFSQYYARKSTIVSFVMINVCTLLKSQIKTVYLHLEVNIMFT